MKFSDVREILYNSDEIAWMDDSLEESVPFVCRWMDFYTGISRETSLRSKK